MAKRKFYVVWEGREPGIYEDWEDAREQIEGYPGAKYKSFPDSASATAAYRSGLIREARKEIAHLLTNAPEHPATHTVSPAPSRAPSPSRGVIPQRDPREYLRFPEIDPEGWAVDASCLGNPGVMEYRCVELSTGREIFRQGPFPVGTNNIGEFLAIVHALALMERRNERHTLYSDSRIAMGWVRKRLPKTTLKRTPQTEHLYELLGRAVIWLNTHTWSVPLLKWDTDRWGEVPADFARK